MSADVTEVRTYQAYCIDCGWWSDVLESEDAADRDADEHDREQHDPMEATR